MKNKDRKNKKLTGGEGFTLSGASALRVSVASLIGAERNTDGGVKKETEERSAKAPRGCQSLAEKAQNSAKITKVSLSCQRAGRGGKTVTIVALPPDYGGDKKELAREMRKTLGCGSTVEEGRIVLQGDIADRVEAWFTKKGVTKITKSI